MLLRGRWTRAQWTRILSGIGGVVALVALALPWALVREAGTGPFAFGYDQTLRAPLWDLLDLNKPYGPLSVLPALWTFDLVWVGGLVLGGGAVLALLRPFGGLFVVGGAALSIAGSFATTAVWGQPLGHVTVTLEPDAGMLMGLAGGLLATAVWVASWVRGRGRSARRHRLRQSAAPDDRPAP